MRQAYLEGPELRGALIAACDYVQEHRADLNRINVFPVPDGDTGTNFALTTRSIADRLRQHTDPSLASVAREAAEAGILGARGNCGMILSHYLLGFAESVDDRTRLTVPELAQALRDASDHVYRALERPVEGTIITVMRETAEAAEDSHSTDFRDLFRRLLERAREALLRTPDLLPMLRAAGVVDAGAKGFVHLLEGISSYISGDPIVELDTELEFTPPVATPAAAAAAEYPVESERYRFCTEALVRGPAIPEADAIRAELRERGDSLVVIRTGELLKLHIHTDEPDEVFSYLRTLGELATHKAEDMHAQHAALARGGHLQLARRPVVIVADTACDLPEEVVRAHGIHLVPLSLIFGEEVLRDRVDLSADVFAQRLLAGEQATTSQPTPAAFLDAYRRAADDGESILVITLASALSGTYGSAEAAARRFEEEEVRVFDSKGVTLLEGLLALKAAELGERGMAPDEIVPELARIRERSGLFFTVDTFDRLLASGRVGRGRAFLGTLLDIKPILALDNEGKIAPLDRVRGRKGLLPKVMDLLVERVPPGSARVRFGVVHVACKDVIGEVTAALRERYGADVEILTGPAAPVLATHVGPGAWGLAYMVEGE
jgi:DegV family protein with EDD domain